MAVASLVKSLKDIPIISLMVQAQIDVNSLDLVIAAAALTALTHKELGDPSLDYHSHDLLPFIDHCNTIE